MGAMVTVVVQQLMYKLLNNSKISGPTPLLLSDHLQIFGRFPSLVIDYNTSNTPAAPIPVPIHMVTMPYLPPVLRKP